MKKQNVNWLNIIFITLTGLVGIAGTILLTVFGLVHWPTWILAGTMALVCGLSVTGGYHRLAAHKSYQALWPVRLMDQSKNG